MAEQYTESDVESLGKKLEEFSKTLTPGEHAALTAILHRAQPQGGDVQGYYMAGSEKAMKAEHAMGVHMLVKGAFGGRY